MPAAGTSGFCLAADKSASATSDDTSVACTYDGFGRVSEQNVKHGTESVLIKQPGYDKTTGAAATDAQVDTYTVKNKNGTVIASYSYTYDANGNIIEVSDGTYTTAYTYDGQNQLIREDNQAAGKSWKWTYDNTGNILRKEEFAYTTGTLGAAADTVNYGYANSGWGDLLISYDGVAFDSDEIGNPHSLNGKSYTWKHGRALAAVACNGTTWTNTYDANGMRTNRTSSAGKTYSYVYNGSRLTQMTIDGVSLHFTYDASGTPLSVTWDDETYYYVTNLQGDITAILNASGSVVVTYTYDAWGRLLTTTGTLASTLGTLNPLRYRGYVYDTETGLYYVSSRYYDPEIGRWINADNRISGVGGDVLGYNMFAYCMNNPVNMSDPSGGWPKWLETAVKVASVVVAVTAVVVMVATVSAVSAGTAAPGALLGASVFLGAALSGINGGVANEAKGNSYINGYLGGATGGAIQGACSKTPAGTIVGGGAGVTVGTAVTDVMNNLDPDSANSTAKEIASNAITSGGKALVTSSLTAYMGYASDLAAINGANGLMPTYTRGFGEAVKAFFGWLDDALVYIWE